MPPETEQEQQTLPQGPRLSRRGFIRGAGVSAAGVALLDGCAGALEEHAARSGALAAPKVAPPRC